VKQEAVLHLRNLKNWTQPQTVNTPLVQVKVPLILPLFLAPLAHFGIQGLSSSQIQPSPLGTVLIMSPWNYPFQVANDKKWMIECLSLVVCFACDWGHQCGLHYVGEALRDLSAHFCRHRCTLQKVPRPRGHRRSRKGES